MIDLEAIGLTKEDAQERLIETLADRMLRSKEWDDEDGEVSLPTKLKDQLDDLITKRMDRAVQAAFDSAVPTTIDEFVANYRIKQTNQYGEVKGKELTFVEFITERVQGYLLEPVDYKGISEREAKAKGDSWYPARDKAANRITFMLNSRLESAINEGIEKAFKDTKGLLAGGMEAAVLAHLKQFGETLTGYVSHRPLNKS